MFVTDSHNYVGKVYIVTTGIFRINPRVSAIAFRAGVRVGGRVGCRSRTVSNAARAVATGFDGSVQ